MGGHVTYLTPLRWAHPRAPGTLVFEERVARVVVERHIVAVTPSPSLAGFQRPGCPPAPAGPA